jgi:hypothetical protein
MCVTCGTRGDKPERLNAIPQTKDRGRRNGLRVDDACGRSPGNQCDRRAGWPHGRSQGRADELTRVRARGARGSTDQGSFRSLQSHVPQCGQHEHAANDRGRDSQRDRDVERLYGHNLGYGCAILRPWVGCWMPLAFPFAIFASGDVALLGIRGSSDRVAPATLLWTKFRRGHLVPFDRLDDPRLCFLGACGWVKSGQMASDVRFIRESGPLTPRNRLVKDRLFSRGNDRT